VLGIAGDHVPAAVSVTDLDDKHVNCEHVTERENADSKKQELEAGKRAEYEEPFHRATPSSILGKSMSCLRSSCKGYPNGPANWFNRGYTRCQGALLKTRLLTFLCCSAWSGAFLRNGLILPAISSPASNEALAV
jgi:hypothetical protein